MPSPESLPALVFQIERLTMRAWPALEEEWRDGWLLRAAQGYTGRANSVNPLGKATRPLPEKIAECEQWYAARKLPTKFRLNPFSAPDTLEATLAARGYERVDDALVMTADLTPPADGKEVAGESVELSLADWFAGKRPETVALQGAIIQRIQPTHWLMGWRCDGELVARGLGVVEDGWLGLFNVAVEPAHRRRGFGRALMAAMLRRAIEHGARRAYLQVVVENTAAIGLYTGMGFREAYRYWYRALDTSG